MAQISYADLDQVETELSGHIWKELHQIALRSSSLAFKMEAQLKKNTQPLKNLSLHLLMRIYGP
jgi:hypothetical protein